MKLPGTRSRRGFPTAANRSSSAAQTRREHPPFSSFWVVFWFFFCSPAAPGRSDAGEGTMPGVGSHRPAGTRLCPGPAARGRGEFSWARQGLGAGKKHHVQAGVVRCLLFSFMYLLPWGVRVGVIALFN